MLAPPTQSLSQTETNPFQFSISTLLGRTASGEGDYTISSADVFNVPDDGQGVPHNGDNSLLVQYWEFQQSQDGSVSGSLIETGQSGAVTSNLLFTQGLLVPCRPALGTLDSVAGFAQGTQMSGTITQNSASLTFQGTTIDELRVFRIDIQASA